MLKHTRRARAALIFVGRVALPFVGFLLALLALEVGVRLLRLAPPATPAGYFWTIPHPLGWALTPGAEGRWFEPWYEYDTYVRVNSRGFRDDEHLYEKPAGTFRILILGDSFVEAAQVEFDRTWHQMMERQLKESGAAVEVMAAGVGGWGNDQALLWFRTEGIKYRPDLVLLAFYAANDFMNNSRTLEVRNYGRELKPFFVWQDEALVASNFPFIPPPESPNHAPSEEATDPPLAFAQPWLKRYSALYRYLDVALREAAPGVMLALVKIGLYPPGSETRERELGPNFIPVAYGAYRSPPTEEWEEAFALTGALIGLMQEEVEASGARFAVLLVPSREEVMPPRWQAIVNRYPAMKAFEWDIEQPHRRIVQILGGHSVPFLDLLPILQEETTRSRRPLYFRHDGHWTVVGNRIVGEVVARWLQESGFLPSR